MKHTSINWLKVNLLLFAISFVGILHAAPINIPMGANAYVIKDLGGIRISDKGIINWTSQSSLISSWFKIEKAGEMNLSIRAKVEQPNTKLKVTVNGVAHDLTLTSKEWSIVPVANNLKIDKAGYIRVDIEGIDKKGNTFAEISDLVIDGSILEGEVNYVKDFSYHFGRRGPSVHLQYPFPENEDVEYFYNEVIVPEGEDVIGSYYMANGFGQGYFGMQANSETERRVLFSVWSPFDTQNPKDIPEDQRIVMLRRGEGVHIGEFGNEGSGGQSFLKYPWKAGNTYKFLLQVHPDGKGSTIYTAYFYATDKEEWLLIASFLRPQTDTWYKGAYSFLENFIPNQGYITRKVLFGNQWIRTSKGKWIELNKSMFTNDATARAKKRMDYRGGNAGDNQFFLQNCGFFDDNTPYRSQFTRELNKKQPKINLKKLQNIPSVK